MNDDALPIETLDYLMIKWKKLASWEDPKYSFAAIFIATIAYFYLTFTDATTMNLTLWAILIAYLCLAFAQTIWPEMSYEEKTDTVRITAEGEEEIPESEISIMVEETKNYYTILKDLRADSPGLFCLFASGLFIITGYLGSYITLLPFLYLIVIGGLVLPLAVRRMKKELPWIAEKLGKTKNMVVVVLEDLWEKSKIKIEASGKVIMKWIEYYITRVKELTKRSTHSEMQVANHDMKNGKEYEPSAIEDVKEDEHSVTEDVNENIKEDMKNGKEYEPSAIEDVKEDEPSATEDVNENIKE